MNDFPARLRRLREKQRPIRSMRVTSELMGLGSSTLRRYERGEREPTLTALVQIAAYYGVSVEYLCYGENKKDAP